MKTVTYPDCLSPLYTRKDAAARNKIQNDQANSFRNQNQSTVYRLSKTSELESELRLAARVEAELGAVYPCEIVKVEDKVFTVEVEAPLLWEAQLVEKYNAVSKRIPGLRGIRVHILSSGIYGIG
jgi:hypothetical protein